MASEVNHENENEAKVNLAWQGALDGLLHQVENLKIEDNIFCWVYAYYQKQEDIKPYAGKSRKLRIARKFDATQNLKATLYEVFALSRENMRDDLKYQENILMDTLNALSKLDHEKVDNSM